MWLSRGLPPYTFHRTVPYTYILILKYDITHRRRQRQGAVAVAVAVAVRSTV